jgi:hypothetical protein
LGQSHKDSKARASTLNTYGIMNVASPEKIALFLCLFIAVPLKADQTENLREMVIYSEDFEDHAPEQSVQSGRLREIEMQWISGPD